MKTKYWYAEQIANELTSDYPNIDWRIDEREVVLRIDAVVNELAKKDFFDNWRLSGAGTDEQYITTWDNVPVTDQQNGLPSYLELPSNYVALPRNGGIVDVVPIKWVTADQPAVVITTFSDYRRYQSGPAANMQGRLVAYPIGAKLYFTTCEVSKKYGPMIVRLMIRDSSMIPDDQPYPIPADKENFVISSVVQWFREKRAVPADSVRDNKDQAT